MVIMNWFEVSLMYVGFAVACVVMFVPLFLLAETLAVLGHRLARWIMSRRKNKKKGSHDE